ncbi:hypothetical protein [Streptomyces sp. NPDC058548]|uniref:hypothetical protein n=1 Tax=Streptomyces sp. NPDC058548 TaxID=3346545 RepID=UPI00364E990E
MVLVAVAVDALEGPLVRVGEVELIGRVPCEARAEIHELALRQGRAVRVNWSGDPEIAAWGLSMDTALKWGVSAEGHLDRGETMITSALFVGPDLADDPYASAPIMHWRDVRGLEKNPGAWPVTPDHDRARWEWVPLERVGPLRFGMTPPEVAAVLDGEVPAGRMGHFPFWWHAKDGEWNLCEDRFEKTGVSALYSTCQDGIPRLGAVTVHGRTGPQVPYAGIPLVGRAPFVLDAALFQHIEDHDLGLLFDPNGGPVPDGLNLSVSVGRAGDVAVSEPTFCAEHWEM